MTAKRDLLMNVFLACPYPVSKWVYDAGRAVVRKNERHTLFAEVFARARKENLQGDYLEFGVYRGTSFVSAYREAQRNQFHDMRFFAFDCFEGLPEGEGDVFEAGEFAFPEHLFRKVIRKAGVPPERTVVVKGFYEDSLTPQVKQNESLRRAAIVHVDCDIYSSAQQVLEFIEELVDVGTILMFDDWYHFGPNPENFGEAKAFGEWRLKDCFEELYDRNGPGMKEKGFIMRRRPEEVGAEHG